MKTIRRLILLASLAALLPLSGAHADSRRENAASPNRAEQGEGRPGEKDDSRRENAASPGRAEQGEGRPGEKDDEPRVIAVSAKRFEFEPKEIRVARGEPVVLEVRSEDVTHGFFSRPLGFDEDLSPGRTTRIPLKTGTSGTYAVLCDHYCGSGHGNMKMTIVVQ
jgi:cytochrome c oxidase subunit 2